MFAENKSTRRGDDEDDVEMDEENDLHLMGVDEAIIHSIEKCGKTNTVYEKSRIRFIRFFPRIKDITI